MTREELLQKTDAVIRYAGANGQPVSGAYAQACEFLRTHAGPNSEFLATLRFLQKAVDVAKPHRRPDLAIQDEIIATLKGFRDFVESGLHAGVSLERQAQLDVVSDMLEQAGALLDSKGVHPAAPAVLTGAVLEEFLRTWVESEGLDLGGRKPSIDTYAQVLRSAEMITKQDYKDITAWAGLRNHAAHGEWAEVADPKQIALMLSGVNHFIRTHGAGTGP